MWMLSQIIFIIVNYIIFNKHFREDHVDTIAKAAGVPAPAEVLLLHRLHCVWL